MRATLARSRLFSYGGRVVTRVSMAYWRLVPATGARPFRPDTVRYVQKGC